jgi:hypothetical protein
MAMLEMSKRLSNLQAHRASLADELRAVLAEPIVYLEEVVHLGADIEAVNRIIGREQAAIERAKLEREAMEVLWRENIERLRRGGA